jgi:ribosomal protein S13
MKVTEVKIKVSIEKLICKRGSYYIILCKTVNSPENSIDLNSELSRQFIAKGNINFDISKLDEIIIEGTTEERYNKFNDRNELQVNIKIVKQTDSGKKTRAERILKSVKGIGTSKASSIIEKLGADCIEKIASSPSMLLRIDGINSNQAVELHKKIKEITSNESGLFELYKFKLTDYQISRIKEKFGTLELSVIKKRCFELMGLPGIGFLSASKIADSLGVSMDDEGRIKACILYTIESLMANGSYCVTKEEFGLKFEELMPGFNRKEAKRIFTEMLDRFEIVKFETDVSCMSSLLIDSR